MIPISYKGNKPQNINYTLQQEVGSDLHMTNALRARLSPTLLGCS
jgi:hypothetical protein